MLITDASLPDGRTATVRITGDRIEAVFGDGDGDGGDGNGVGLERGRDPGNRPAAGEEVLDASGYLLLPAPAEPHAHLDKALTADRVSNPGGHLSGAVAAWLTHRTTLTAQDFVERATRAALAGVANGCTAIRTHVDIGDGVGTTAAEALLQVKADLAGEVDLQVVGLVGRPTAGRAGAPNRELLRQALDMGVDVVGGCPHLDDDPAACLDAVLALAAEHGRPLDLHTDENLDRGSLDLEALAQRVRATGFPHGVVASHCVSLGIQPPDVQRRVARQVANAGIAVVTLPQTNLFLQARGQRTAPPRGLTALAALDEAGVVVAAGADNLQDPFCTVGRADPLETAALLVMAGHLTPEAAYDAVSDRARRAMGLEPISVAPGSPAELLLVRAASVRQAVAEAPAERIVLHRGRIVARTTIMVERPLNATTGPLSPPSAVF